MAIGVINYPASLDTPQNLIEAGNRSLTTLTADITASATTLSVADTATFPPSGTLSIDAEIAYYASRVPTSFHGVERGREGTTAAAHLTGSEVRGRITARHHSVLAEAIIALEQRLGVGAGTISAELLPLTGGQMLGPLLLAADPVDALGAVTKAYVDALVVDVGSPSTQTLDLAPGEPRQIFYLTLADETAASCTVVYQIFAFSGAQQQMRSGRAMLTTMRSGAAFTSQIYTDDISNADYLTAIFQTATAGDSAMVTLVSTSSLTSPQITVSYRVENLLGGELHFGEFSPIQFSPLAWFKADSITGLAPGTPIAAWPDSSGNGRNAGVVGTPTYQVVGGLPAVAFNGGDQSFVYSLPAIPQPFTVITRMKQNTTSNRQFFWMGPGAAAYCYLEASNNTLRVFSGTNAIWVTPDTLEHTYEWVFQGAQTISVRDASETILDTGTAGLPAGSAVIGNGGDSLVGHYREFMIFAGALAAPSRQMLRAYLEGRW